MWMERICSGVLEVHTESGPDYVRPSWGERIRLLWTFRNFRLLPRQVLSQRELTLVSALLQRGSCQPHDECCIGTVEWTASLLPVQSPPRHDPPTSPSLAVTALASKLRPRSRRRRGKKSPQGATDVAVRY